MRTNNRFFLALGLFLFALASVTSCDDVAPSKSGPKVVIDIQINRVSAGFVDVTFTPDQPAYYAISVDPVVEGVDPAGNEQVFMDLALDSLYMKYVVWRHAHLIKLEHIVADFPSHSLMYGETNYVQNFLKPDTDYWVYCFVVDHNSNKADGQLYWTTIHTEKESIFNNTRFKYRIKGEWDYIYPYNKETGDMVIDVPWVGMTIDKEDLVAGGYASPGAYFDEMFKTYNNDNGMVLTGVYVHQNNGVGDGSSRTKFEVGHTYYTGLAIMDGPRGEAFDIYSFTWEGPDTDLFFEDSSSTLGAW